MCVTLQTSMSLYIYIIYYTYDVVTHDVYVFQCLEIYLSTSAKLLAWKQVVEGHDGTMVVTCNAGASAVRQRRWPPTMAMNEIRDPILPWKLTCPLKIDGWKMYSLLKWSLFRGFQGCKWPKIKCPRHPVIVSDDDWGVQSPPQHGIIFRFHYHSQKVIGSLGTGKRGYITPPDAQMYGIFTYIWPIFLVNGVNRPSIWKHRL